MAAIVCIAILSAAAGLCIPSAGAADNGAEEIVLDGGSREEVFFPHRRHQEAESITCQACHDLFPRESGSIDRLKEEGTLKARQVMNSQCIACHRETASEGKPSGPRSCSTCHGA
jgi:hypothetical protein